MVLRIRSRRLPANTAEGLAALQQEVNAVAGFAERVAKAKSLFASRNRHRNPVFKKVRQVLDLMCAGAQRCMYCEDSAADEVEHFKPKNLYPEACFLWANYLYACGPCNGPKNNRFPIVVRGGRIDETRPSGRPPRGRAALFHPRIENPLDHMQLDIPGTFLFVPIAEPGSLQRLRAELTIEILTLNRDVLVRARREAYESYRARLVEYVQERDAGAGPERLTLLRDALIRMAHPTVWEEIKRQYPHIPEFGALFDREPAALNW